MSNRKMKVVRVGNLRQNPGKNSQKIEKVPQALQLRPEYRGQPVAEFTLIGAQSGLTVFSTTVTTGVISNANLLSKTALFNVAPTFATRFAGFQEFRIRKVTARIRTFSSTLSGVISQWFSEDDSANPSSANAVDTIAQKFPAGMNEKTHSLSYTPRDPAQQTWTLVASGNPVIGYHKIYTDNATWGSSIVATPYLMVEYDCIVQFRGMV